MTFPPYCTICKTVSSSFMNVSNELCLQLHCYWQYLQETAEQWRPRKVPNDTQLSYENRKLSAWMNQGISRRTQYTPTVANINMRCPCRHNVKYMWRPFTAILIRHEIMEKSVHANALCCCTRTPLTLKNSCGNSLTSKITLLHLNPILPFWGHKFCPTTFEIKRKIY